MRGRGVAVGQRQWRLRPPPPPDLPSRLGLPPLWTTLLYHRGITERVEAEAFLSPDLGSIPDPFLLPDMERAVHRLLQALLAGETIGVYGDFDTDGVTASALLWEVLTSLGARVEVYIPHRVLEGHGLNREALARLRQKGVSLLLTVDCGITAHQEVREAIEEGMEVIITDHHTPPTHLPPALAVISPRHPQRPYPFPNLAGVGLAWKVAQALSQALGQQPKKDLLELVALGTIADLAPLVGENRALVKAGLEVLGRTARPGLRALAEVARAPLEGMDTEGVSFILAPRLNAAGRMDTAYTSFSLLTTPSTEEAARLARELEHLNRQRQDLTDRLLAGALEKAQAQARAEALVFLADEEFVPGVSGLVASKLVEVLYRPAVVVALEGEMARASARSIPGFDIADALARCGDLLLRFGGHAGAAGFLARREALSTVQERLLAQAREALPPGLLTPCILIDAEAPPIALLGETFRFLQDLGPFGHGNPSPVFLTRSVRVEEVRAVGDSGEHMSLKLRHGGVVWDAVAFRWGGEAPTPGGTIDIAYIMGTDVRQGRVAPRLLLRDLRPSSQATPARPI